MSEAAKPTVRVVHPTRLLADENRRLRQMLQDLGEFSGRTVIRVELVIDGASGELVVTAPDERSELDIAAMIGDNIRDIFGPASPAEPTGGNGV